MKPRHWRFVHADDGRSWVETCECDEARDHLDDGTPVLNVARWIDQHILCLQGDPGLNERVFDWRGGHPT